MSKNVVKYLKYIIIVLIILSFMAVIFGIISYNFKYFKGKTKNPAISVIMPVYNSEEYLSRSVSDVLNQTFKDFELICINDGSKDNSLKILKTFEKKNKNMRVYSQRNRGAGSARNKGFSFAKGKYVIFLDSDDSFDKNMLEIMYKKAVKTNSDIVICSSETFVDNEPIDYNRSIDGALLPEKEVFNRKDFKWILNFSQGQAWDKLYRRDFIVKNNIKFLNLKNTNDAYFTFLSLALANKITTVNDKLVNYYYENKNSYSKNRKKYPLCPIISFYKLKRMYEKKGIYKEIEQSYINAFVRIMLYQYHSLDEEQKTMFKSKIKKFFPDINIKNYDESYFIFPDEYYAYIEMYNSEDN